MDTLKSPVEEQLNTVASQLEEIKEIIGNTLQIEEEKFRIVG